MAANFLLFLGGILLLWGSSELLTRKIGPIARRLRVKELVVTVLGVSVFSSIPELTVSAFAIASGNSELSLGNVIGSNFVTLTFVTAVCALIRPIEIHREVRDRESSWMILSSAVVLVLSLDHRLDRLDGALLVLLYIPYAITVIRAAVASSSEAPPAGKSRRGELALDLALSLAAIGGIIGGSKLALVRGEAIGLALGISPLALGVVLFAFGTSLPELAISLSASLKRKADVTIGEVYASNIFTQLVVLGICCLISPIDVSEGLLGFAMPFLVLAACIIQIFVTTGLRLNRLEAFGLLALYAAFAISNFMPLSELGALLGFGRG
jgi:cation:H+ antiporter